MRTVVGDHRAAAEGAHLDDVLPVVAVVAGAATRALRDSRQRRRRPATRPSSGLRQAS